MKKSDRAVLTIALALCLILLVWGILFKFTSPRAAVSPRRTLHLIPFGAMLGEPREAAKELAFNLLAFVPLGMLLSALNKPRRAWGVIAVCFLISLLFEALQYFFRMGCADITDIIMNTAGGALGVGLYAVLRAIVKEKAPRVTGIVLLVCEALFIAAAATLFVISEVTY